jgi:hypothetical protein
MFIQILFVLLIIIILCVFIKNWFISSHVIFVDDSCVKYTLHNSDNRYLKKYGKILNDNKIPENSIFYTTTQWNILKNNNYVKHNNKYYIIEPGYYYNVIPEAEFFINNNINIIYIVKKIISNVNV